jgi:hypothetical protein
MGVPFAVDIYLILIFVASSMKMLHETVTSNEKCDDFVYITSQNYSFLRFALVFSFEANRYN